MNSTQLKKLQGVLGACQKVAEEEVFQIVDWKPFPNSPQLMAYHSPARELLFGGSPSGGKSALLIGWSLTGQNPKSLIIRREYPQLQDLILKVQELVPDYGGGRVLRLRGQDFTRVVEFGSCQYVKDAYKYRGREHGAKLIDEVTTLAKVQYDVITAWCRSPNPEEHCRIIATANPPEDESGLWVVDHWSPWLDDKHPNPAVSGEIRYFVRIKGELIETDDDQPVDIGGGKILVPQSKTFIRADVYDNPLMMASGYQHVLENLPEELQHLNALSFLANTSADPYQIIPREWLELSHERWRRSDGKRKPMTAIAADPARGGGDRFGIATRRDDFVEIDKKPGKEIDNGQKGGKYVLSKRENGAIVMVDVIGIGASTFDYLQEQSVSPLVPMVASHAARKRTRCNRFAFANKKAQWWWKLREALDPDYNPTLALPPDPELTRELTAPRWKMVAKGIQVESKDEVKSRIGVSTDLADAVVMVCSDDDLGLGLLGT